MLWVCARAGEIPAGTAEDVEAAVAAARTAFKRNRGRDWARAPGAVRAKYLRAIAAKVRLRFCRPAHRRRRVCVASFEKLRFGWIRLSALLSASKRWCLS